MSTKIALNAWNCPLRTEIDRAELKATRLWANWRSKFNDAFYVEDE